MQAIVPTRRISGFEHSIDFVRKLFLGAFAPWLESSIYFFPISRSSFSHFSFSFSYRSAVIAASA